MENCHFNGICSALSFYDDNGHRTHVAGIIGTSNNDIGTVGIVPEYAVKSFDQNGSGYYCRDTGQSGDCWKFNPALLMMGCLGRAFDIGSRDQTVSLQLQSVFRPSVQSYMVSWLVYDPQEVLAALEIPIMIKGGTADPQVPKSMRKVCTRRIRNQKF